MKSLHHHRPANNAAAPNLFDWADAREGLSIPFPARVLARRYGLPTHRARLIAELAGLGVRQ